MKIKPRSTRFYSSLINPLIFVISFSILLTVLLIKIYNNTRDEQIRNVKTYSENVASRIEFKLKGNLDFINLLVKERASGLLKTESFNTKIAGFLDAHPEFINITWIDSTFVINNVAPISGNSQIIGLAIELPEPKKASRMAKEMAKPIYTEPFEAIQSNSSFEVWVPVFSDNKFIGLFAGVYSCEKLLKSCLDNEDYENSQISLLDEKSNVIAYYPNKNSQTNNISHSEDINLSNLNLKIKTEAISNQSFSWISILLLSSTVIFVLGFSISLFKLTEENRLRKKAQVKLKKSKNYLDNIINSIGDPVFVKDDQSKLLLVNNAFCTIFNLSRAEIIGKTLAEEVPIEEQENFLKIDKQVLSDGKENIQEESLTIRNNEKLIISTRKTRFIDEYGKKFLIGVIHDISDLKHVEHKLLQSKEKAEESDNLKTEFINNMSHEIRTPMNGILGFTNMLNSPDVSDAKRANFIKIIQGSGAQLLKVIDDILEISRLGTKQVKILEETICLNNLMYELFSIFDIKAKENKTPLYLKNELNDNQSTILIDCTKLTKILSNLLENALKFTNQGFIEFGYQLKNNSGIYEIELYVMDTGVGIEKVKHESIFERFSQAEKDLSKNVGGLGLGLSIAKENTELLGGKIRLESKKGKGSTFFVTIPYNPIHQHNKANNDVIHIQHQYTILIAEDEEVNYLYFETLLQNVIDLDCKIIQVINGKEAVKQCKENLDIDLVLMDLKMPLKNGYDATKQIKEFRPNLPIIAQTAYSTSGEKRKAFIAGCDDFISKPISKDTLKLILDKYLVKELKN